MNTIKSTLTQAAEALREHRPQDALRLCGEAVAQARQTEDALQLASTFRHTANINSKLGRYEIATAQISEAVSIYRRCTSPSPLDLANALRVSALNEERRLVHVWHETKDLYASLNVQAGVEEAEHHIQKLSPPQTPEVTQ
jgi:hypothetical protein